MKRHEGLATLSREHHLALVLARALEGTSDGANAASAEAGKRELLARVRSAWVSDLQPHFAAEERQLVPLSLCGSVALRDCARQVLADHHAIRQGITELTPEGGAERYRALGALLSAHVRFEERSWFVALEAELAEPILQSLAFALQREPQARIRAFRTDDAGAWVAELECGHPQHVRHRPPFQSRPWVTSEQGRAEMIGAPLPCGYCHMSRLPECIEVYKETPIFDEGSLPDGLRRSHSLRAETWGIIEVLQGRVRYVLEYDGDRILTLRPGIDGVVAPQRPHHVELEEGAQLRVRFARCKPAVP